MANKDFEDLQKSIIKKIQTTMIGSIADIEDLDIDDDIFDEIRKSILDRGNDQIKMIIQDLKNYKVTRVYYYNFRIKE